MIGVQSKIARVAGFLERLDAGFACIVEPRQIMKTFERHRCIKGMGMDWWLTMTKAIELQWMQY